jgi:hypothetical protein
MQAQPPRKEISMTLEFTSYSRKPFDVEAVQITKENIEEVARFIGTVEHKEDGTPYIFVDRRILPQLHRVYPGFWMTKMGDQIRCFSGRIFDEQFEPKTPVNKDQLHIHFVGDTDD